MSWIRIGSFIFPVSLLLSAALPQHCEARGMRTVAGARHHEKVGSADLAESKMAVAIPSNIFVRKDLQPFVAKLLRLSPTFRRQFERIGCTGDWRVTIILVSPATSPEYHARSIITKARGTASVKMEIVALSSYAEMMGHEFEHLLEQLDGLNLAALAGRRGSGVDRHADGSFETTRAISAGQTVAREYFEHLHAR